MEESTTKDKIDGIIFSLPFEDKIKCWELIEQLINQPVPYQLCPKCNGQGQVSKPPYIAGDVHEWTSSSCIFTCDVCNGSKIIPMHLTNQTPTKQ
jgi:DnaJ-class molecular chaperone